MLQKILGVSIGMDKFSVVLEYEPTSLGVCFPYISGSVKVSCQKFRKHSSWAYFYLLKMITPRCFETLGHRISRDEAPYSRITDTWHFVAFTGLTLLPWLSLFLYKKSSCCIISTAKNEGSFKPIASSAVNNVYGIKLCSQLHCAHSSHILRKLCIQCLFN